MNEERPGGPAHPPSSRFRPHASEGPRPDSQSPSLGGGESRTSAQHGRPAPPQPPSDICRANLERTRVAGYRVGPAAAG